MSRRNAAVKREVLPDPLYGSVLVTKVTNQVMYDGKKGIAQSIVYTAMKNAAEKLGESEALTVLTTAFLYLFVSICPASISIKLSPIQIILLIEFLQGCNIYTQFLFSSNHWMLLQFFVLFPTFCKIINFSHNFIYCTKLSKLTHLI